VPVLLGILVAASFGSADFLGGYASRRASTLPVLATAQGAALVAAVVYAASLGGSPSGRDLTLGAAAGTVEVLALAALYAGLATGRMGVVAPVTAVVAACIPVAWGLTNGESPSTLALIGVVLAVGAGGLVASERGSGDRSGTGRAVALAVFAGTLFGTSLVLLSETGHDSGAWPVLAGRVAAVVGVLAVILVMRRRPGRLEESDRRRALGAGFLDVTATVLVLIAVREGLVAVVAPVAALGPAFTVICAWLVLKEPVARVQLVGLVVAVTGLTLIAVG
jgi:uncharacterized membrane protein